MQKSDIKELIISNLNNLKKKYSLDQSKKWNLKALSSAIKSISEFKEKIISGTQLKEQIKGIGDKISKRIDEIIETGKLSELNEEDNTSNSLNNLLLITGVGLTRAKKWVELGINNIDQLKEAIKKGKVTSTHHIDIGIKYYEDFQLKISRDEINKLKENISKVIKNIDKNIIFEICGSYRRGLLESGDIDILLTSKNSNKKLLSLIVEELIKAKIIIDNLTNKGDTKFMGVCILEGNNVGRRIDIRYVDYESFYTSIIYFTGSKNFNVYLRNKALENKYTLNEYSLSSLIDDSKIIINSEKDIFDILDIPYLKPTERNM